MSGLGIVLHDRKQPSHERNYKYTHQKYRKEHANNATYELKINFIFHSDIDSIFSLLPIQKYSMLKK